MSESNASPAPLAALVAELRALEAKATPGPWRAKERWVGTKNHMSFVGEFKDQNGNWTNGRVPVANASLIAALRNASPALMDAAERVVRLEAALTKALPILERAAESDCSYGYVCVTDPRDFHPDPECSTEEERANHKRDCEAWNRGEQIRHAPVHAPLDLERSIAGQMKGADAVVLEKDASGNIIGGHVTKAGYGLGTSTLRDEEAEAALDAARAALSEGDSK